jgi:hypothetical protein
LVEEVLVCREDWNITVNYRSDLSRSCIPARFSPFCLYGIKSLFPILKEVYDPFDWTWRRLGGMKKDSQLLDVGGIHKMTPNERSYVGFSVIKAILDNSLPIRSPCFSATDPIVGLQ